MPNPTRDMPLLDYNDDSKSPCNDHYDPCNPGYTSEDVRAARENTNMSGLVNDLELSDTDDQELNVQDNDLESSKFSDDEMDNDSTKKTPTKAPTDEVIASGLQVYMHKTFAEHQIRTTNNLLSDAMRESGIALEHNKSLPILEHKKLTTPIADLPENILDPMERLEKLSKDELINQCLQPERQVNEQWKEERVAGSYWKLWVTNLLRLTQTFALRK